MTPDSNNPRLINWPSEVETKAAARKAFDINVYTVYRKNGFIAGVQWLSTRLEPEASPNEPGQSGAQGLPLDIMNENNPYSDLNYGRKVGWHEGAEWGIKYAAAELAALRKEAEENKERLKVSRADIKRLHERSLKSEEESAIWKQSYNELLKTKSWSETKTDAMRERDDLQQQNQSYRELLNEAKLIMPLTEGFKIFREKLRAVLSSGEKKPETK